MTSTSISHDVRALLSEIAGAETVASIRDDDLIFQNRVVDSLHLIELVERLQLRFQIEIDADDLVPENFESLAAISGFVSRRCAG